MMVKDTVEKGRYLVGLLESAIGKRGRSASVMSHIPGMTPEVRRPWVSGLRTGVVAGASITGLAVGAVATIAGFYARTIVTPPKQGNEALRILGVGYETPEPSESDIPTTVTLPANDETLVSGRYMLFFDGGRGYAVVGDVVAYSPRLETVTRRVVEVHEGDLREAKRGRWSGAIYENPGDAGYDYDDVTLELPVGDAPAWVVPAPQGSSCRTWAVMVHGRGAARQETLRSLDTVQELGMTSIHVAYRNDRDAPPSEDGRYGLGFTEWEDIEIAIRYALDHGAHDVVLFGWSMGGAIALQATDKSQYQHLIKALVLDGPVVDWFELIRYHSRMQRLPLRLGQLVSDLLAEPRAAMMTGLGAPILLSDLDWLSRSDELLTPTLILHSVDDEFVPVNTSVDLASRNSLVELVPFHKARHTKEWNVDPERWKQAVVEWLPEHLFHESAPTELPEGESPLDVAERQADY
ncbi:S9 family peptidase [uncultured Kocuria sp.]|uniref:alpha/beta hydrolase family protein n=2 Tax=Kocuria TaxID=57493 RepID=UPI0025926A57|nr:alpha/beta fold hydrolase [uncultured Kocuria sp.]